MTRSVRVDFRRMVPIIHLRLFPEERHDLEKDAVCDCSAPERKQDEVDERAERHVPIIQNKAPLSRGFVLKNSFSFA